jgi:mRNA-degrading endonuclease toxin of MazEF toxin-antitoxin module
MNRGDVVIADIPYSDRTGSKIRPAMVVSTDRNNAALADVLVAAISRVSRPHAFTHVFLDPATPDGQAAGVLHPSYVQCENLLVLDKGLVLRTIGNLSPALTAQLNQCLKLALDLP